MDHVSKELLPILERVFNSISSIERITLLQFRDIEIYESDDRCSPTQECIIADIELTLKVDPITQQIGPMNNGKSLIGSVKFGLRLASHKILLEWGNNSRNKRKYPNPVFEFSTPIMPIEDIPAMYILTSVCVFGGIVTAIYYFWSYLKIFHQSHKIVWKHGKGILERIKVIKSCLFLTLGLFAFVTESLACRDYVLGKRKESTRVFEVAKTINNS